MRYLLFSFICLFVGNVSANDFGEIDIDFEMRFEIVDAQASEVKELLDRIDYSPNGLGYICLLLLDNKHLTKEETSFFLDVLKKMGARLSSKLCEYDYLERFVQQDGRECLGLLKKMPGFQNFISAIYIKEKGWQAFLEKNSWYNEKLGFDTQSIAIKEFFEILKEEQIALKSEDLAKFIERNSSFWRAWPNFIFIPDIMKHISPGTRCAIFFHYICSRPLMAVYFENADEVLNNFLAPFYCGNYPEYVNPEDLFSWMSSKCDEDFYCYNYLLLQSVSMKRYLQQAKLTQQQKDYISMIISYIKEERLEGNFAKLDYDLKYAYKSIKEE